MLAAPSSRPKCETVLAIQSCTALALLMSNSVVVIVDAVEELESVSIICRAAERICELRSARERRAPCLCSWRATARPIPLSPVMAYTLPLTESIAVGFLICLVWE